MICDNNNHVVAIHKTCDAATRCFDRFVSKGNYSKILSMTIVETNDIGDVTIEYILLTHSKIERDDF